MNKNIKIDLYKDWLEILSNELSNAGFVLSNMSEIEIVRTHLNYLKRLVMPIPRIVHKSLEFNCPNEYLNSLAKIEKIISTGKDLSPYLSRLLKKHNYNDPLLNHWDIHHVHLGDSIESDGFIERTGPLLFVRFHNDNAYFINIFNHGVWTSQNMIKILHDNWPVSLEEFKLKNSSGIAFNPSDENVSAFRKHNVNSIVYIDDDNIYFPFGGGVSSSGISREVVIRADMIIQKINSIQDGIINSIDDIKIEFLKEGYSIPAIPEFKLEFDSNNILHVTEIHCDASIKFDNL